MRFPAVRFGLSCDYLIIGYKHRSDYLRLRLSRAAAPPTMEMIPATAMLTAPVAGTGLGLGVGSEEGSAEGAGSPLPPRVKLSSKVSCVPSPMKVASVNSVCV